MDAIPVRLKDHQVRAEKYRLQVDFSCMFRFIYSYPCILAHTHLVGIISSRNLAIFVCLCIAVINLSIYAI